MTGKMRTKRLTSIVAIDSDGAIGCRNELPWKLKTDMTFFRTNTVGNAVIMGRKTYDSIGGCLPKRKNVVLSHNNVLFEGTPDCQLALSIPESLFLASRAKCDEIFVVGGGLTYSQFAPLVDRYLITIVDHKVSNADAFLVEDILTAIQKWGPQKLSQIAASDGVDEYPFSIYEVNAPDLGARRTQRAELIKGFSASIFRKKPKRNRTGNSANGLSQDAFAF